MGWDSGALCFGLSDLVYTKGYLCVGVALVEFWCPDYMYNWMGGYIYGGIFCVFFFLEVGLKTGVMFDVKSGI